MQKKKKLELDLSLVTGTNGKIPSAPVTGERFLYSHSEMTANTLPSQSVDTGNSNYLTHRRPSSV